MIEKQKLTKFIDTREIGVIEKIVSENEVHVRIIRPVSDSPFPKWRITSLDNLRPTRKMPDSPDEPDSEVIDKALL